MKLDYQQKMNENVERYTMEDVNWRKSEIERSDYHNFCSNDDEVPLDQNEFKDLLPMIGNAILYVFIFMYFFGVSSLIAYLIALLPLCVFLGIIYAVRGNIYSERKSKKNKHNLFCL